MSDPLAERWRAARPPAAGLHLDSAACSRQSFAAMEAASRHALHESEVGGYGAAEAAEAVLDAGRAAVATLVGMEDSPDAQLVFTTGSLNALDLLLGDWPRENRSLACLPGEYGPNLAVMAAHGFEVRQLPVLGDGRLAIDDAAFQLEENPPGLVHLTPVASHRGTVQPLAMVAKLCRELGVPLVVDAAQALGQIDCAVGADAIYSSSRKWIAGPRGVGVLAMQPALADRLTPRLPVPFGFGEANIAARVGFSVALGEHLACGPEQVRARLTELAAVARGLLSDVDGWVVVEEIEEPSAITTLAPVDGADPEEVRGWLLTERRILTTYAGVVRAPMEMTAPVLRISPHVDTTADDLETFAEALIEATAATSA